MFRPLQSREAGFKLRHTPRVYSSPTVDLRCHHFRHRSEPPHQRLRLVAKNLVNLFHDLVRQLGYNLQTLYCIIYLLLSAGTGDGRSNVWVLQYPSVSKTGLSCLKFVGNWLVCSSVLVTDSDQTTLTNLQRLDQLDLRLPVIVSKSLTHALDEVVVALTETAVIWDAIVVLSCQDTALNKQLAFFDPSPCGNNLLTFSGLNGVNPRP